MALLENRKFIKLNGKIPTHSLDKSFTRDEVKDCEHVAMFVDPPYVVLDIDNKIEFMLVLEIIEDQHIPCRVMKTKRGGHFWFKSNEPIPNNIGINTPLSVKVDIRSHGKKSYVKVRSEGVDRKWVRECAWEDIGEIPFFLKPVAHTYNFVNAQDGENRNADLYACIIPLIRGGLSKDEVRDTYRLINDYVFAEPLPKNELETILRDEAFDNIRPMFYHKKKFLHDKFAHYFNNDNNIFRYSGNIYSYVDGRYKFDDMEIERRFIKYLPELSSSQRREVLKYLRLIATERTDHEKYYITVKNGIYDIKNDRLIPARGDLFITNKLDVDYLDDVYDEATDKMLNKIACHDPQLRKLLEEAIGYLIFPSAKYQKAFMLLGQGANGKSTFIDMLSNFLGSDNIASLGLEELNSRFKVAELTGKLANFGDDIDSSYMDKSGNFKKLVTGDRLMVERKGEHPYMLQNYAKMIFSMNTMFSTGDKSQGLLRRLVIIPFNAKFSRSDSDYDPFIVEKLSTNQAKSYLLKIAAEGLQRLIFNGGFTEVDKVTHIIKEFEVDNNNVLQFLEEFTGPIEGRPNTEVYSEYTFWCAGNMIKPHGKRKFNDMMRKATKFDTVTERIGNTTGHVWRKKDEGVQ